MLKQLVVFTLDAQLFALPLASVRRVVRMVEVTPLPKAPDIVLGVIDVQGNIIPVMSMRKRFGRLEPETGLSGQLIVADTATRIVALAVNSVTGVIERTVAQVSYLFRSVVKTCGPGAVGVLLTGMGKDGARELKLMKEQGALTIAQDRDTSVVYGMPGEAIKLGGASYVLSPEKIRMALASLASHNVSTQKRAIASEPESAEGSAVAPWAATFPAAK